MFFNHALKINFQDTNVPLQLFLGEIFKARKQYVSPGTQLL